MNRTDRLHALHEELRHRGEEGATAGLLAATFEVSVRTIKRDITALQEAGTPIWSQHGPGGGYRIDRSATVPPVAFTPAQAVAAAVALSILPDGSPFGVDAKAAAAKLRHTLGPDARRRADVLAGRIWVLHDSDGQSAPRSVLRALEASIIDGTALSIDYRTPAGEATTRIVEPILIAWGRRRWYAVAHCRLRNDIRWFRLDRIEHARNTNERYTRRPVEDIGQPPDHAAPITG